VFLLSDQGVTEDRSRIQTTAGTFHANDRFAALGDKC